MDRHESDSVDIPRQRLIKLLAMLSEKGYTQRTIARQAGFSDQFLTDLKNGRRDVSELAARRISAAWGVNYEWLTGSSDSLYPPVPAAPSVPSHPAERIWLPVFRFPVEGEPTHAPHWDGATMEVASVASPKLAVAELPYILVFGHDDVRGRLRRDDRVLISQRVKVDAELSVVRSDMKLFLARPASDGTWRRAANDKQLSADCRVVGHAVAIIWSPLDVERK